METGCLFSEDLCICSRWPFPGRYKRLTASAVLLPARPCLHLGPTVSLRCWHSRGLCHSLISFCKCAPLSPAVHFFPAFAPSGRWAGGFPGLRAAGLPEPVLVAQSATWIPVPRPPISGERNTARRVWIIHRHKRPSVTLPRQAPVILVHNWWCSAAERLEKQN